jgi:hypothetical protein
MTLKDDIEIACSQYDMHDIVNSHKKVIVCPLPGHVHHSNTPSFSIFWRGGKQWFRCHGNCQLEGDIVDLIGFLRVDGYSKKSAKTVRAALSMLSDRFTVSPPVPQKETNLLQGDEWTWFLPPHQEAIDYAHARGLNDMSILKFNLGQSKHHITIPTFHDGRLMGIKLRNTQKCDIKHRFYSFEGSRQGLFNFDKVNLIQKHVFIVKGEIPAMLLDQMGYNATAPTGGEGGWNESWRTSLALAPKTLIGDNDDTGYKLGPARAAFFAARLVYPPKIYKDIDQFCLAEPEAAKAQLDQWIKENE